MPLKDESTLRVVLYEGDGAAPLDDPFSAMTAKLEHLEFFRPGKPQPTHRDTVTA